MSAIGIALGPVIGGVLLAHFSWGSIFLVNIPVVVVALIGGHFLLPTSKDPSPGRMDLLGSLLTIVALGGLVFAVIEGPDKGWTSATVLGAAVIGAGRHRRLRRLGAAVRSPDARLEAVRPPRLQRRVPHADVGRTSGRSARTSSTPSICSSCSGYSALRAGVYSIPFAAGAHRLLAADALG